MYGLMRSLARRIPSPMTAAPTTSALAVFTGYRPKSPAGRTARASRRIPNETASDQDQIEREVHQQSDDARHQEPEGEADAPEVDRPADVRGLDQPVVDAVLQAQPYLDDEEQAEEEHEPAQRFLAASLEARVVDPVDAGPEPVEHRREHHAGQDRVEAVRAVHHVGRVRPKDHERRMG